MHELQVFFDYACPYCYRAHGYLVELLPLYPKILTVWRPCESHPRPERYGMHSDLAIRGMFFARDRGASLMDYHRRMYQAAHGGVDIEDPQALARVVYGLLDPREFMVALQDGSHIADLERANSLAYDHSGVWVVPAYRMNGKRIDPREDVGVSREQLKRFLDSAR